MAKTIFIGLVLNFDSAPMRVYGPFWIAGFREVLVKTARVVIADGAIATFAPPRMRAL